jgi:hypothetical protein
MGRTHHTAAPGGHRVSTPQSARASATHFVIVAIVLGVVAALAPAPWYLTDRENYEQLGRQIVVPDCSSLHCFRMLVPIVIEQTPGPSLFKWKAYAVVANAGAAVAVGRLSLLFGLSPRAALLAMWMSALGFGSLFTLFDPHTADPLMYLLGPVLAILLIAGRVGRASVISAIGIFAKEFAAAPLWMAAIAAWLDRRRATMIRTAVAALSATVLWMAFQLAFVTALDYSYGWSPSAQFLEGGYIVHWVRELGPRTAISTLVIDYGVLYLLVPAGLLVASQALRHWAIASIPAIFAFAYVQQPDRALWNFHFIAMPLAALAAVRLPRAAAWVLVAAYAAVNLRVGAQLQFLPSARFALTVAVILALAAIVKLWRERSRLVSPEVAAAQPDEPLDTRERRRLIGLVSANVIVMLALATLALDLWMHRRVEEVGGVNKWGYRGPVAKRKQSGDLRVVVLGGSGTFGRGVLADQTFAASLGRYVRQGWRPVHLEVPVSAVNLAAPLDGPSSFAQTLHDYLYLRPDVAIFVAEAETRAGPSSEAPEGWRRTSTVFRYTGYMPLLPAALWGNTEPPVPAAAEDADTMASGAYCDAIVRAVDSALANGTRALVVSAPYPTAAATDAAAVDLHRGLAAALQLRFTSSQSVRYVDLGRLLDMQDKTMSFDGVHLTGFGHEQIAEALTVPLLEVLQQ